MNAKRLLTLCLKEAWDMWLPYLTKNAGDFITKRETVLSESSFGMGWEARGIHNEKEAEDVEVVAWYLVDKDYQVKWAEVVHFDPRHGGDFSQHPAIADRNYPNDAPHSWQPLVRKV